jgi:hypothetical protein
LAKVQKFDAPKNNKCSQFFVFIDYQSPRIKTRRFQCIFLAEFILNYFSYPSIFVICYITILGNYVIYLLTEIKKSHSSQRICSENAPLTIAGLWINIKKRFFVFFEKGSCLFIEIDGETAKSRKQINAK